MTAVRTQQASASETHALWQRYRETADPDARELLSSTSAWCTTWRGR